MFPAATVPVAELFPTICSPLEVNVAMLETLLTDIKILPFARGIEMFEVPLAIPVIPPIE